MFRCIVGTLIIRQIQLQNTLPRWRWRASASLVESLCVMTRKRKQSVGQEREAESTEERLKGKEKKNDRDGWGRRGVSSDLIARLGDQHGDHTLTNK